MLFSLLIIPSYFVFNFLPKAEIFSSVRYTLMLTIVVFYCSVLASFRPSVVF